MENRMKNMTTHYDNLQVSPHASASVIRAAYKALSQKWHPDLNRDNYEFACQNFHQIKHSYDILSNPVLKQEHDRWINNVSHHNARRLTETKKPLNYCSVEEEKRILYVVA